MGEREKMKDEKQNGKEEEEEEEVGNSGHNQCVLLLQESKGYDFESETDTESIAKLVKYMYDNRDSDDISFTTLVERVIQQLVMHGAQCGVGAQGWMGTDTHPGSSTQGVLLESRSGPGSVCLQSACSLHLEEMLTPGGNSTAQPGFHVSAVAEPCRTRIHHSAHFFPGCVAQEVFFFFLQ